MALRWTQERTRGKTNAQRKQQNECTKLHPLRDKASSPQRSPLCNDIGMHRVTIVHDWKDSRSLSPCTPVTIHAVLEVHGRQPPRTALLIELLLRNDLLRPHAGKEDYHRCEHSETNEFTEGLGTKTIKTKTILHAIRRCLSLPHGLKKAHMEQMNSYRLHFPTMNPGRFNMALQKISHSIQHLTNLSLSSHQKTGAESHAGLERRKGLLRLLPGAFLESGLQASVYGAYITWSKRSTHGSTTMWMPRNNRGTQTSVSRYAVMSCGVLRVVLHPEQ